MKLSEMLHQLQNEARIGELTVEGIEDGFNRAIEAAKDLEGLNNKEALTEHNTNVVSRFMEHCKEEGQFIPDIMFETYFNA